jgi:hypothetical protein
MLLRNDELLAFRKKRYVEYKNSESKRTGPGEGGKAVNLEGEEKILGEKLYKKEAFNIIASDKISLQRSVPDVRDARLVEKYETFAILNFHRLMMADSLLLEEVTSPRKREYTSLLSSAM